MDRVTFSTHLNHDGTRILAYGIEIDGYVQPFGAIFSNRHGRDVKRYVKRAVSVMNRALAKGETSCVVQGHATGNESNPYTVDFSPLQNSQPGEYPSQVMIKRAD